MRKPSNIHETNGGSVTVGLPKPRGLVYFVYSASRIKIGYTADLDTRLANLANMGGSKIELIALIHGDKKFERSLHATFKADRTHGEWFVISEEIRRFLACLDDSNKAVLSDEIYSAIGSCVDRLKQAEAA